MTYARTHITLPSLLVVILGLTAARAQSFYNNGSTVSVLAGTIFSVKDSLVNTGSFVNNGNLVIGGTWLNTGAYNAGVGEITFNSTSPTSPQIINHSNQSFSKLTISGGGRKLILADVTIENEIILAEGIIEAENDARVIFNATATVSGGSDGAHIHAPVYHQGSGEKLFPLGSGSVYLPVTLLNVEDPQAVIGVEVIEMTGGMLPKAPSLDHISSKRYWRIDVAEGSLHSRIALPVRDESALTDPAKWIVAESDGQAEKFESIGRSSTQGTSSQGMVTSDREVTRRLVALAASSDDGSPLVYNALSPNGDGLNDFLRILNIENYPTNKFTIFNRWGDKVFAIENYDNREKVFRGKSNINGDTNLPGGTYFYTLETESAGPKVNGFLILRN